MGRSGVHGAQKWQYIHFYVLPVLWFLQLIDHCSVSDNVIFNHFLSDSVVFMTTEICSIFVLSYILHLLAVFVHCYYVVLVCDSMNVVYVYSEVNGFLLCFKMGKVPLETQSFSHSVTPARYFFKFIIEKLLPIQACCLCPVAFYSQSRSCAEQLVHEVHCRHSVCCHCW